MTTSLTPPPEYDVPRSVRGRRREELLLIVSRDSQQPARRSSLTQTLVAAAAVAAVIIAGTFGLSAYRESDRSAQPAATMQAAHPPAVRNLNAAETEATLQSCTSQTNAIATGTKGRFAHTRVVDAFTFTEPPGTGYTKTWLIGRRLLPSQRETYEICGLDANGKLVDADMVWLPHELTGLVAAEGRNQGMFSLPVARVTVQTSGSAEIDAVVRNGFWFAPIKGNPRPFAGWSDLENTTSPDILVGVYPGVRLRGYSAGGQLLYDSERDAITLAECDATKPQATLHTPEVATAPSEPKHTSPCPLTHWKRADPGR
jgi:hypothetical protein